MADGENRERRVERAMLTMAPYAETVSTNPDATIDPIAARHPSLGRDAMQSLRDLHSRSTAGPGAMLEVERTLGEGGMGVVKLATQVALGRKVAVKLARDDAQDDRASLLLLREGWVTGALEHPNVVPVHDITLDDKGNPVLVLKRIEGEEWRSLMRDPERVRERSGADDLLEWNLDILLQAANALRFAHDRRIVHRDLKPENVMVGSFGEVYLLDWGIAVSLEDDSGGRFPLASESREMAGTPSYMAPEMLGGDPPHLDERTDVYLLGSTLYEILSGHPPHTGTNIMQLVRSVVVSAPPYPEGSPRELYDICRKAMSPEQGDRYESVDAFRQAIQAFLHHRSSAQLAAEATECLGDLKAALQDGERARSEAGMRRIYDLFGEARFGFRQALKGWPDNAAAREGLRMAVLSMADYELGQGDAKGASVLLGEIDDVPEALADEVATALEAQKHKDERLSQLELMRQSLDPEIGRRARTGLGIFLGALWTLSPLGGIGRPDAERTHAPVIYATLGFMALALLLGYLFRKDLGKTLVNRRLGATIVCVMGLQVFLHLGAQLLGVPSAETQTVHMFLWASMTSMVAIHVDRRLWVATFAYLAAFLAAAEWPALRYWVTAASNGVLTLVIAWMWRKPARGTAPEAP